MDKKQKVAVLLAAIITVILLALNVESTQKSLEMKKAREARAAKEKRDKEAQSAPETTSSSSKSSIGAAPEKTAASTPLNPGDQQSDKVVNNIVVNTPEYKATFSSRGAALVNFELTKFFRTPKEKTKLVILDKYREGQSSLAVKSLNRLTGFENWNYEVTSRPGTDLKKPLTFTAVRDSWKVTRNYYFTPSEGTDGKAFKYGFKTEVIFENLAEEARTLEWTMSAVSGFIPDDTDNRYGVVQALSATSEAANDSGALELVRSDKLKREAGEEVYRDNRGQLAMVGVRGRFFAAFLRDEKGDQTGGVIMNYETLNPVAKGPGANPYLLQHPELVRFFDTHKETGSAEAVWLSRKSNSIASGNSFSVDFDFYGGPISPEALSFDPVAESLVSYSYIGMFEPISRFFAGILEYIYSVTGNYGIAVILLTLIIKTALHGLTRKGLSSAHKMQKVQPLLKEVKEKYKDDRQKQQTETMRIFREHGVSPMSSCLPMLLQMPILFALFGVFSRTFAMRQAMFIPGWIDDLSQPDRLFGFGTTIWPLGDSFNLLPVLSAGIQYIQQSMTPKTKDPQMAQQQAMMKWMPAVMAVIFFTMPAGLVLYFTVSSAYTLVEHWFIRKKLDGPSGGKDGGGSVAKPDAPSTAAGVGMKAKQAK